MSILGALTSFFFSQTSQSLSVYSILCEKYKLAIERDPQYLEYLDKIGQVTPSRY